MNKTIFAWLSITIVCLSDSFGQKIENSNLSISYNKTTSVVFPFSISSVDRGSKDVLAQKVKGVQNVLQVKAGRKDFAETNLTVITADGTLHEFTVTYSDSPSLQTINVADTDGGASLILVRNAINEREIQEASRMALKGRVDGKIAKDDQFLTTLTLQEVYIRDDILYYRLHIRNRSSLNYDVKSLKFFIRDKKKVKRTSSQELELVPVYVGNETANINAFASATMVYAVRKFTIPDGKTLHIHLFEANGGRNLSLTIKNRHILKAKLLPETNQLFTLNKN